MVDVMQAWSGAGVPAVLDDIALKPRRADASSTVPLMIKGGQASVYCLTDGNNGQWWLKKFLPGREPAPAYVEAIQPLIPCRPGFESGFERRVLKGSSVSDSAYSNPEFASWVDGTILMREVAAPTWAELAASIKTGAKALPRVERLFLCGKLSEKVDWLESASLAHRDLSAANVMVDPVNVEVHLIDWDSLYHPSLAMSANAAPGTEGYMAPFVRADGGADARLTWQEGADRFALAILNAEILAVSADSALSPGGGLFAQDALYNRTGRTVSDVRNNLQHSCPGAARLLDAALTAPSFEKCPGPSDWINLLGTEMPNGAHEVWAEESPPAEEARSVYTPPYEPHFVEVNSSAFVRLNRKAFVEAPRGRRSGGAGRHA